MPGRPIFRVSLDEVHPFRAPRTVLPMWVGVTAALTATKPRIAARSLSSAFILPKVLTGRPGRRLCFLIRGFELESLAPHPF
jgi:hypothetical protein